MEYDLDDVIDDVDLSKSDEVLMSKANELNNSISKLDKKVSSKFEGNMMDLSPDGLKAYVILENIRGNYVELRTCIILELHRREFKNLISLHEEKMEMIKDEIEKNENFSEETKNKFKELEEQVKKKSKRISILDNLNFTVGVNPFKFTGAEID